MKKIFVIALALFITTSAARSTVSAAGVCSSGIFSDHAVRGSGKLVSKTISAPDFHSIEASRAVTVIVTDQPTGKITIEADDNLIDLVVVEAVKGTLRVTLDNNSLRSISNANVTVTVPANGHIRSLEADSASKIICKTALGADKFSIETSSAAYIEAAVKAGNCSVEASSASSIKAALKVASCSIDLSSAAKAEIAGSAETCTVEMDSASELSAEKFLVTNLSVGTSSGAEAAVNCTGKLRVEASSGSAVQYSGDCSTDIDRSSGACVSKD